MKDNEKKVKATEEVKEEVQTEEEGVQLTDEELSSVAAGLVASRLGPNTTPTTSLEAFSESPL